MFGFVLLCMFWLLLLHCVFNSSLQIFFHVLGVNTSGIHLCLQGFYCPSGTGYDLKPCPIGTYGSKKGISDERDCTPCDGGKYCKNLNLTEPSDSCDAGYYCESGAGTATPLLTNLTHCPVSFVHLSVGGICPAGFFCPQGSHTKTCNKIIFILEFSSVC